MIICIIVLMAIIIFLIYIINKKNIDYTKLLENYNSLNDEYQFVEREVIRYNIQLGLYIEDKKERKDIIINDRKIKINNIYEGKRVLLGDYCKDSSNYSRKILESFGLTVDVVRAGYDIVDRIAHNFQYDLIITNSLYKNSERGEDILEQLREIKEFNTPIILHTINKNKRHYFIKECKFDEYLEKPLDKKEVEKILLKFIK